MVSNRPKERLFHLSFDTLRLASQTTKNLWKIDLQNYVCCLYKKTTQGGNPSTNDREFFWRNLETLSTDINTSIHQDLRATLLHCSQASRKPGHGRQVFLTTESHRSSELYIYPIPVWPLVNSDFDSGFQ